MSFSSVENKRMIWNILSEQCQANFNIELKEVQNFPAYFESFVADIGKEDGTSMMEKNKSLIGESHKYMQFYLQNKERKRENMMEKRLREASNEMNTILQGYRPPEIDFSDSQDDVKRSPHTGAPPLQIDMGSSVQVQAEPLVEKHVAFKTNKHYSMKATQVMGSNILFQNLTLESIKILSILLSDKRVYVGKDKLGKKVYRWLREVPFVFCTVYVNDVKEQEEIIFVNEAMAGSFVRFEPKVPLSVRKKMFKMEVRLFDEEKRELNMGMEIGREKMIEDDKYVYVEKVEGMKAGDLVEIGGRGGEILGLCRIEDKKVVEEGEENYAAMEGELRGMVYYGKPPIVLFVL